MFVTFLKFAENRAAASEYMAAHNDWIARGFADGAFLCVGSLAEGAGGAILADGESREAHDARIAADPFVAQGVVRADTYEVDPKRTVEALDFRKVARFDEADVARLLADSGIVRHRGKIEAVINNARRACELADAEGSLAAFFWRFEPASEGAEPQSRSTSPASEALAKELRKRGWKFVGPTTVYAFMQAMGLVNDHAQGCVIRPEVEDARSVFRRPGADTR